MICVFILMGRVLPGGGRVFFDVSMTVGFCIDAIRENRTRSRREVTFSDLSPQEENQLYTCDQYFVNDEAEKSFFVAGREITAKQLADALHSLPEEKRQAVLLYYFFDMTDVEIAELMKIPRSTVQFRRTSSFELLKRRQVGKGHFAFASRPVLPDSVDCFILQHFFAKRTPRACKNVVFMRLPGVF